MLRDARHPAGADLGPARGRIERGGVSGGPITAKSEAQRHREATAAYKARQKAEAVE